MVLLVCKQELFLQVALSPQRVQERQFEMSSNQGNLEWNSNTEMYEANVDGKRVQVSNDEFSESEAEMVKDYLEKGLSQEQAEAKAWDDCRSVDLWMDDGHIINKKEERRVFMEGRE